MLARRTHTFRDLATAINAAFARWDLAHLHVFDLADGTQIIPLDWWDEPDPAALNDRATNLSRLGIGEQFAYTFDLGDDWTHLCTVAPDRIDPLDVYGAEPASPVSYFGWGAIPDQYDRAWDGDDGETPSPVPPDPPASDLPPILHWWGQPEAD